MGNPLHFWSEETCIDQFIVDTSINHYHLDFRNSGIPYALQQSGFVVGLLLLIIAGVATDYTVMLLIKNGILASKFTYQVS